MDKEAREILECLYLDNETLTTTEIADETGFSETMVEHLLDKLENRRFVNIGMKINSTNYQHVEITPEGEHALEADTVFGLERDLGPETFLYTQQIGREA